MPLAPPASIGIALDEVDTPALVLDLDALERNLQRMADAVTLGADPLEFAVGVPCQSAG